MCRTNFIHSIHLLNTFTEKFTEKFLKADEDNKITILSNGAEEGASIDPSTAQSDLEKVTLLVDQASTKKEKIEATLELRKAKARLQAVA